MTTFTAEQVGIEIIRAAAEWLDLYEVRANAEWSDERSARFAQLLADAGHQPGWSYCATSAKAWWLTGYTRVGADARVLKYIRQQFTPGVIRTATNLKAFLVQERPLPGSLMVQRLGTTWKGHNGIVTLSGPKRFHTIEANTSPGIAKATGQEREGDGIYLKPPKLLDFTPSPTGLWLMGFILPQGSDEIARLMAMHKAEG